MSESPVSTGGPNVRNLNAHKKNNCDYRRYRSACGMRKPPSSRYRASGPTVHRTWDTLRPVPGTHTTAAATHNAIDFINSRRGEVGLPPIVVDPDVAAAAAARDTSI